MTAREEDRISAVVTFAKWGASAVAAIGSAASLAYVAGYLNRWSYFRTFGAAWLARELIPSEILIASFDGLLPVVLLGGVAMVQSAERPHAERSLQRTLLAWSVAAVAFVGLDLRGQPYFLEEARAVFSLLASFCVIFASVAVTKLGVVHLAEDRRYYGGIRATHALLALAVAGFVFAPLLAGRADALGKRANDMAALPRAQVRTSQGIAEMPLLFAGAERIYCVRAGSRKELSRVIPLSWENVDSIAVTPSP